MTTTNANRVTGDPVVIPAEHIEAIRTAALGCAAVSAEVLAKRASRWPHEDLVLIETAKGRLDQFYALFEELCGHLTSEDAQLDARHRWAAVEAIDYVAEDAGRDLRGALALRAVVAPDEDAELSDPLAVLAGGQA